MPQKRKRQRRRRAVSLSSSSSSSSSSDEDRQTIVPARLPSPAPSSSSSDSSSDDSMGAEVPTAASPREKGLRGRISRSISPPPLSSPTFTPSNPSNPDHERAQRLKDRFKTFWMSSVASGFQHDLEHLQKEPNMDTTRLSLLIDSLASGADVYTMPSTNQSQSANDMSLVVGSED